MARWSRIDAPSTNGAHSLRSWLVSLAVLALLTLAMFGDVLLKPGDRVLSNHNADLFRQFVHWRAFGFAELRHGNLALWNPHLFSGAPFFGGFQSALLYLPNALFLMLPLASAINWSIALHVFLAGAFVYAWAARRRLHPLACFLSAVIFMFCGGCFLHIYVGHLPNLCAAVWAPLLFLAIDGLFEKPNLGWCLLGMFTIAMQVFAGHPQYVFYTGVAAVIYSALCFLRVREPKGFLLGLMGIVVGGFALSAVQLLTGLAESRETLRGPGVSYAFAAMFSFPPENLLTLLSPHVFGDMKNVIYWGRGYLWEMSLFLSVTGLVLAAIGAIWGGGQKRRFAQVMVLVLLLLALGKHTPLLGLLYHWAPSFDKFRGSSKFIFLASLFAALLAGVGLDSLLHRRGLSRVFIAGLVVLSVILAACAFWSHHTGDTTAAPDNGWHTLMLAERDTGETYLASAAYNEQAFVLQAARLASSSLLLGAGVLAVVAILLFLAPTFRPAAPLLVALAAGELFWFARSSLDTFALGGAMDPATKQFLAQIPGDYRILNLANPNAALSMGAEDIWGYDPGVMRRYAELLAFIQAEDPDRASQYLPFLHGSNLYRMLRCRFSFIPQSGKLTVYEATNIMPRLQLVSRFKVIPRRNDIFAALTNTAFNPREEVILETAPNPAPQAGPDPGTVNLVDSSTDYFTLEADLRTPSILLITDAYARGWQAQPLPGSCQHVYEILPANYCLRAVPLLAGRHRLRLEYAPFAFQFGRWISLCSVALFLMLTGISGWKSVPKRD